MEYRSIAAMRIELSTWLLRSVLMHTAYGLLLTAYFLSVFTFHLSHPALGPPAQFFLTLAGDDHRFGQRLVAYAPDH